MKDSNTRKYNHYLYELISYLELNPNSFAEEIGLDRTDRIYNVLNNKNGISANLASKITKRFPEISFDWLKNNEGEMLLSKRTKTADVNINIKDLPHGEQMELIDKKLNYLMKSEELNRVYLKTLLAFHDIKIDMFKSRENELDQIKKTVN